MLLLSIFKEAMCGYLSVIRINNNDDVNKIYPLWSLCYVVIETWKFGTDINNLYNLLKQ
jgi:hypothetical protein